MFETKVYQTNLKTDVSRFAHEICKLQNMKCRLTIIFYFIINSWTHNILIQA